MGTTSSIQPKVAETQEPVPKNVQNPDITKSSMKSSPATKCEDSCPISANFAEISTAQGTVSKANKTKASPKRVTINTKVQSSSQKQDLPLKVTPEDKGVAKAAGTEADLPDDKTKGRTESNHLFSSLIKFWYSITSFARTPTNQTQSTVSADQSDKVQSDVVDKTTKAEATTGATGSASELLQSKPDENKNPTQARSSFSRVRNSLKNIRENLTSRKQSTASTDPLKKDECEEALSIDSTVEANMLLHQNKLNDILASYKKKLTVLLVFPKVSKQFQVFSEAFQRTNFSKPSQAIDGQSSITYCRENIFDLIIIDATKEKLLDAKDLCRKIRVHNPETVIVAVRQRTYWPFKSDSEQLSSFIFVGFTRVYIENHNINVCLDALTCYEKDIDAMIQLRLLKGLYSAFENVHEIIEVSSPNHDIQFVNKAYERLLGYSLGEVKGKPWYEPMVCERNPADQPMKIKQQLDSSNPWEGQNYIKKKTGEHVSNTCHIIPVIEAGKVLQFIGIRKLLDTRQLDPKVTIDCPSSSSCKASGGLTDVHSGSRRLSSSVGFRDRMTSITASPSPHSFFSNPHLITEVTTLLASIRAYPCPQTVYQVVDKVTDMIRSSEKQARAPSIFKEDDELITELLDGLMTASIPTNVEEDLRGRRRSTYYPMSKSVARMVVRHSDTESIAALPLSPTVDSSAIEIRKLLDSTFTWNFNVLRLEELTNKRPLLYVGLKIFQTYEVYSFLNTDVATFKNWLDVIEHHYNSYNPYHNSTHAADVLQAAASLCRRQKIADIFDDMDIASTLIAAAIHDLDHPGKTNSFLINSSHKLAILYNDVSVLENHHTALAFRLSFKDSTVNIFQKVEKDDYRVLRQQIIDMVLATDMTKHFDYLGRFNDIMRRTSADVHPTNLGAGMYPVEYRTVVKRMLIKCCDVSNPTRPLESCKVWAARIAEEYCQQTDEEKARGLQVVMPVFDRTKCNIPKTQLSFMNLFIVNMMESWNEFCPIPDLMRNIEINFDYWQSIESSTQEKVIHVVNN